MIFFGIVRKHFGEKAPAFAVAREVIEAKVGGDGSQPAAHRWAMLEFGETFVRFEEHLLRDILRFGLVRGKAHGSSKYHVLVVPHELLKMLGLVHRLVSGFPGLIGF
jgi:hypothetical protein